MSEKFDYKYEISKLEEGIRLGTITAGEAFSLLAMKMHEHFSRVMCDSAAASAAKPCEPVRVSFRKNVEVAPYKHEHVEVTVELNGSSFAEAMQKAKDLADDALGLNAVDEDDIAYAKEILRKAARSGKAG
jgi:hypothetical protein